MRTSLKMMMLLTPQGGSLLPFTDDFARVDGDVGNGWEYSAGKWTISDGKLVSNPSLGSNLVANGNMETGNPPSNWTAINSASLSSVADERTGGSGSASMEAARGSGAEAAKQTISMSSGKVYLMRGWAKRGTSSSISCWFSSTDITSAGTDWNEIIGAQPMTGAAGISLVVNGSAGQTARFDDWSVNEVTLADTFCTRDVGTPNHRVSASLYQIQQAGLGLVVGLNDAAAPATFVAVWAMNTRIYVGVWQAGSHGHTAAGSILPTPPTSGETLTLEKAGKIVRLYYEGVQIWQDTLIDNATFASATRCGVFNAYSGNAIGQVEIATSVPQSLNGDPDAAFAVKTAAANLWTTSGGDDWLGRPVLADDGDKWIAIYRAATGHTATGAGKFHIRFSEDEGATWTNENVYTDGNAVTGAPFAKHGSSTDVGDAIVFVAPNGDILIHAYEGGDAATHGTYQYRSTDGGATFSDEGLIDDGTGIGGQDYTIVGTDIYITIMADANKDRTHPWVLHVYKSSDNGANWTDLGAVDASLDGNEAGIEWLGGNNLIIVERDTSVATIHQYTSSDLGQTWGAASEIEGMGIFQRPRMKRYAGGVMMFGRDERGATDKTVVWYLPPGGSWCRKFYPDASAFVDCGYCDVLERSDGTFYMLTYGGTTVVASVRSAVFEIV